MKIRCALIDDEELARGLLEQYILKIPQLELVGQYKNPLEFIDLSGKPDVDLLFLDIQMPEITGTEFLKSLRQKPVVVFTTAYPEYALEGYQLDVADYLVKPFTFDRFLHSIQKVSQFIEPKKPASNVLIINAGHKTFRVPINDILYIEGLREYVSYYTSDGQRIVALESLKNLEENLPQDKFIRVHKSYIININRAKVIEGNTLQITDKKIPIGASYKEEAIKKLIG